MTCIEMKRFKQKTLLHTAPFGVRFDLRSAFYSALRRPLHSVMHGATYGALCGVLLSCMMTSAWAKTSPNQAQYDDLKRQDIESVALFNAQLRQCAAHIAPAQCQRQAQLDQNSRKHAIKLKRSALNTQDKQREHAEKTAQADRAKANTIHGKDAAGAPLPRAPLSKVNPNKNTSSSKRPLSQPSTAGAAAPKGDKKPLLNQGKRKQAASTPKKPLSAQPSVDQRRSNVAKSAGKEGEVALRKTKAQQKQAKRAVKDQARQAAGYTVDKPK